MYRTFIRMIYLNGAPWTEPISAMEADERGECITQVITEALDNVCPAKCSLYRRPVPWWTKELTRMRKSMLCPIHFA
jgi:hypothetical protein